MQLWSLVDGGLQIHRHIPKLDTDTYDTYIHTHTKTPHTDFESYGIQKVVSTANTERCRACMCVFNTKGCV